MEPAALAALTIYENSSAPLKETFPEAQQVNIVKSRAKWSKEQDRQKGISMGETLKPKLMDGVAAIRRPEIPKQAKLMKAAGRCEQIRHWPIEEAFTNAPVCPALSE
jgi:hypothetical protein